MNQRDLKEERMKILELLAKKVITAEEAEKLLTSLNIDQETETVVAKKSQFKLLKVLVNSADGDNVNIQIPIEFARLLKNKKFITNIEGDFDLDIDELLEMIYSGANGELVNIKSSDGDIVKIVVE